MWLLIAFYDLFVFFFFFNDTATTEIYTLSLHDALLISDHHGDPDLQPVHHPRQRSLDRKSTRLNSSHLVISYAVFCLKKKTKQRHTAVSRGLHPRTSVSRRVPRPW